MFCIKYELACTRTRNYTHLVVIKALFLRLPGLLPFVHPTQSSVEGGGETFVEYSSPFLSAILVSSVNNLSIPSTLSSGFPSLLLTAL